MDKLQKALILTIMALSQVTGVPAGDITAELDRILDALPPESPSSPRPCWPAFDNGGVQ